MQFHQRSPDSAFTPAPASPLRSFLQPRSVAIVGASPVEGKVGHTVLNNMLAGNELRAIYPVNSGRDSIMGLRAYPSIGSLPETPELAIVITPAVTVPDVVRECAAAGVPAVLIISAGFREAGEHGRKLEQEILAEARGAGMRIIGPNCLGVMSPAARHNATFAGTIALPGDVAFLSQSGALCTAVLDWSLKERVGFSALISLGSMLDVGWPDVIRYFGDDPETRSIIMYMETVGDARAFITAAREVALRKPIVVIKAGRSAAAAKATMSHTGSLAGSDAVLDAAFRRCGVLRVRSIADLFYMADVLGKQPLPKAERLSIVTNAGGPGVLATDALDEYGGSLAELSSSTLASLDEFLPAHWSHGNPIDVLGDASAERYARAAKIALADPDTDGVIAILTPQGMTSPTAIARALAGLPSAGKPVLASFMGGESVMEASGVLSASRIPSFPYPDSAARVFSYMWQYSRNLKSLYETPVLDEEGLGSISPSIRGLIAEVGGSGRTVLTEFESKQILKAYRIPVVETVIAEDEERAAAEAARLGFPVVVKLHSQTITHKTDVGGVVLDLRSEHTVREAFRTIRESVIRKAGPDSFHGVSVQRMLPRGYELILGASTDPQFGPVLLFGLGGELVEVFRDRALALPPLNTTLARRMMEQTQVFTALGGVRGRKPADLAGLERILVRFGRLVVENPRIREVDINPLLVSGSDISALDARIILHPATVPDHQLPKTAIRPYPAKYSAEFVSRASQMFHIRPIRPEDELKMVAFHEDLSDRSVQLRYFAAISYEQRIAHERLTRICAIDYEREMALVAESANDGRIAGVGRFVREPETSHGEFAVVVADQFQRQGVGTELLKRLVEIAREENVRALQGWIIPGNTAMQQVTRKLGFENTFNSEGGLVKATLPLS